MCYNAARLELKASIEITVITGLQWDVSMLSGWVAQLLGGKCLQVLANALARRGRVDHIVNVT